MKGFLDNRETLKTSETRGKAGKITNGEGFRGLVGEKTQGSQPTAEAEEVPNPESDPNAPKVEFIREGEAVKQIIVSFGEQKVEIDCEY